MIYDFQPQFTKIINIDGEKRVIHLFSSQKEKAIHDLLLDKPLLNLVKRYCEIRQSRDRLKKRDDEVALRRQIFPMIEDYLRRIDRSYVVFSSDIGEEIFNQVDMRVKGDG